MYFPKTYAKLMDLIDDFVDGSVEFDLVDFLEHITELFHAGKLSKREYDDLLSMVDAI